MKFILAKICLLVSVLALVTAEQDWYNLKTTWHPLPLHGFDDQPKTIDEALYLGWKTVSNDCSGASKWPGHRMAPPGADREMIFIYDVNGYVAGMHSIVRKEYAINDLYASYTKNPAYNLDTVDIIGEDSYEAYLTTVFFVDPEVVCTGRSHVQFEMQGTGYVLHFQNGPNYESRNLVTAPVNAAAAIAEGLWYEHYCFLNMGDHFFQLDYDVTASCEVLFPVQLLYDHQGDRPLVGFVWQHVGALPGSRWETVTAGAIDHIVNTPPECLKELAEKPGVKTMHVYLKDYIETCLFKGFNSLGMLFL